METKEQSEEVEVQNTKVAVAIVEGVACPANIDEEYRLANMYFKTQLLPNRFKTAAQIQVALHFARENFPRSPLTALRQIAVIHGVPCLFGDLPLSKVQQSGKLYYHEEYFIDDKHNRICVSGKNLNAPLYGAVCIVERKSEDEDGRISRYESFFTMEDAKKAGIIANVWLKYPRDMLMYKARGRALKNMFADCLNGAGQGEFDFGVRLNDGGIVEGEVIENVADEMNKRYGKANTDIESKVVGRDKETPVRSLQQEATQ